MNEQTDKLVVEVAHLLVDYKRSRKDLIEATEHFRGVIYDRQNVVALLTTLRKAESAEELDELVDRIIDVVTQKRLSVEASTQESSPEPPRAPGRPVSNTTEMLAKVALEAMVKIGGEIKTRDLTALISESSPDRRGTEHSRYSRAHSVIKWMCGHGWISQARHGFWVSTRAGEEILAKSTKEPTSLAAPLAPVAPFDPVDTADTADTAEPASPVAAHNGMEREKVLDLMKSYPGDEVKACEITKSLWPSLSLRARQDRISKSMGSLADDGLVEKVRRGVWKLTETKEAASSGGC